MKNIHKNKVPLNYIVQEYWVGVQISPNIRIEDYMGMPIENGGKTVGIIRAYHDEKGSELVKIYLDKPVHCNDLFSIGIPPDNMVPLYSA